MEEFLKNKYGIDHNTRLGSQPESCRVGDLVRMLRERGLEKNIINNLHNSALNKEQVLLYLDQVTNQLAMKDEEHERSWKH